LEDPDPDQDQDFDPDSDPFTELGVESDPHGVGTFGADLRMGDPLLRSPLTVDQSPLYRARTLRDRRREREAPADRPRANTAIRRVLRERLTDRDVWILRMLTEHRVLTTHQIADLAFSNEHTARRRMLALLSLGVVDRFRPYVAVGSVPLHYVLSAWGGDFLRHLDRDPAAVRHWRPANLGTLAVAASLPHRDGTHDLMTGLAAYARAHPDRTALTTWWSDQTCKLAWNGVVRPDAYGRWATNTAALPDPVNKADHTHQPSHAHQPSRPGQPSTAEVDEPQAVWREVDFFLEYDTGSENLARVVGKLGGYARLAATSGWVTPVLFAFHSAAREATASALLARWAHDPYGPSSAHPRPSRPPRTPNHPASQSLAAAPGLAAAQGLPATGRGAAGQGDEAPATFTPLVIATTTHDRLQHSGPAARVWRSLGVVAWVAARPGRPSPASRGADRVGLTDLIVAPAPAASRAQDAPSGEALYALQDLVAGVQVPVPRASPSPHAAAATEQDSQSPSSGVARRVLAAPPPHPPPLAARRGHSSATAVVANVHPGQVPQPARPARQDT
jgi:hypothetical protein